MAKYDTLLIVGGLALAYLFLKKNDSQSTPAVSPAGAINFWQGATTFGFNPASITQLPFQMSSDLFGKLFGQLQEQIDILKAYQEADARSPPPSARTSLPENITYQERLAAGYQVISPFAKTIEAVNARWTGQLGRIATNEEAYYAGQTVDIDEIMRRRGGALPSATQGVYSSGVTIPSGDSGGSSVWDEKRSIEAGLVHLGTPIGTVGVQATQYTPNSVIQMNNGSVIVTDEVGNIITDTSAIINETSRREREKQLLGG